jgi:hypothetical protein
VPLAVGANSDGWGREGVESGEVGDGDRRRRGNVPGSGRGSVGDLQDHRASGGGHVPVFGYGLLFIPREAARSHSHRHDLKALTHNHSALNFGNSTAQGLGMATDRV